MEENRAKSENHSKWSRRAPVVIAIAVAVFGVLALLIVDHGPWSPKVRSGSIAAQRTTGEAARAAGATVTPTTPNPAIEPE